MLFAHIPCYQPVSFRLAYAAQASRAARPVTMKGKTKKVESRRFCRGYIGIMENQTETTVIQDFRIILGFSWDNGECKGNCYFGFRVYRS